MYTIEVCMNCFDCLTLTLNMSCAVASTCNVVLDLQAKVLFGFDQIQIDQIKPNVFQNSSPILSML